MKHILLNNQFIFIVWQIVTGSSVTKAFENYELSKINLDGLIIDIGSGVDLDYIDFIPRSKKTTINNIEVKNGYEIDYEFDKIPEESSKYDTTLLLNVIEHVYNHKNILKEAYRVTKKGGNVLGFVPFLMWYHPDPSDFFRFSHECLENIFKDINIKEYEIKIVSRGPFTAASHMFLCAFPKFLRIFIFLPFYFSDSLFILLRPEYCKRFALGYIFTLRK